jgi:predicted MFS family arabinose efflux permease
VAWALGSRAAAAGTYFALLFVLSLYLQQALNLSPLYAGLALVAWVGAFGSGGPLLRRLPRAVARRAATLGSLGMAFAYAGLAIGGGTSLALLVGSLGVGGLGFGLATTALLTHLTTVTPTRNAGEISGLYNTNSQVAAVAGLACFGTLYLGLADNPARAFGAVCVAFAATALLAAFAADQAVRVPASARVPSGGPIVAARPAAGTAAAGHPRAPGPAPSRAGRM